MGSETPKSAPIPWGWGGSGTAQFGDLLNQNFSSSSRCPEFAGWDWRRDLMRMQRLRKWGKTRPEQEESG